MAENGRWQLQKPVATHYMYLHSLNDYAMERGGEGAEHFSRV